jgi:hypothetical protein
MCIAANCIVILLEAIGLSISISDRGLKILAYYTQISNIITLLSSIFLLALGSGDFTCGFRYLSSCMLTMTFLITLCVLVPMGGGFRKLMLSGNGLYHHTLCPIISVASYIFWEDHNSVIAAPVLITFVYGMTMICLNYLRKFDGPYPFFRVHKQSREATLMWIAVLVTIIKLIARAIELIAK